MDGEPMTTISPFTQLLSSELNAVTCFYITLVSALKQTQSALVACDFE